MDLGGKEISSRKNLGSKRRKNQGEKNGGARGQPAIEEAGNVGHTEKKIKNPRGKV